jgi:hypothetical protein
METEAENWVSGIGMEDGQDGILAMNVAHGALCWQRAMAGRWLAGGDQKR